MIQKIDSNTLKFLELEYEAYLKIDQNIATRKVMLNIGKYEDENVGGGKSNLPSRPTENKAIQYIMDPYIVKQEERRQEVENALAQMDEEQLLICDEKFWSNNYYTWNEIADMIFVSSRTIYKKRYKILELLAKEKGIIQS